MRSLCLTLPISAVLFACAPGSSPGGGSDSDDSDNDNGGFVDAGGSNGFIDAAGTANDDGGTTNPPPNGQACDKIDILFVIDNSGSMQEEQDNLAANFPSFAQQIDAYRNSTGQPIDYHVGVTTTAKYYKVITRNPFDPTQIWFTEEYEGANGELLTVDKDSAPCGFPAGRNFLQRGDADFASKLSCALKQGINGDANEMPLEATRRAVVDRVADGTNTAFLRDDALLAVVMLTDENDCSVMKDEFDAIEFAGICAATEPVQTYLSALDGAKGARGKWAVASIAGETNCESDFGSAVRADRLLDFSMQTGENAVFSSICSDNLAGALSEAFDTFSLACENIPIE